MASINVEKIYPDVYDTNNVYGESNVPNIAPKNVLAADIDELATKWLVDKVYAMVENGANVISKISAVSIGGFVGLGLHYLGKTIMSIGKRCDMPMQTLRYYRCQDSGYRSELDHYSVGHVHEAFDSLRAQVYNSCTMFGIAGVLTAVSFGAFWLQHHVARKRMAAKHAKTE